MSDTTTFPRDSDGERPADSVDDGASVHKEPTPWHWAALIVGNVALALGPWSVRVADSGPVSAGFWRLLLALPFLYVFARMNGERVFNIPRKSAILVVSRALPSRSI